MSALSGPVAIVSGVREELVDVRRALAEARELSFGVHRGSRGRLAGRDVVLTVAGDGATRAGRVLDELLAAVPCAALVGIGVAGGLSHELRAGDLVVASEVRADGRATARPDSGLMRAALSAGATPAVVVSTPVLVATPAAKAAIAARVDGRRAVVDLESATWAAAAASRGMPWVILRVVSDASSEELPEFLVDCQRDDGSIDRGKLAGRALAAPTRLTQILRLRHRVQEAASTLSGAVGAIMIDAAFGNSREASREATSP